MNEGWVEVERVADPIRLSFLKAVLDEAGVDYLVLDDQVAAVFGSALGARLMVDAADERRARGLLAEIGEG